MSIPDWSGRDLPTYGDPDYDDEHLRFIGYGIVMVGVLLIGAWVLFH